ncbi:MAG: hypothetical protein WCG91_02645 [Candidatus Shapirobacteria bacterium]
MTPTEYIQKELNKIKDFQPKDFGEDKLLDEIFRLLMSKKFRKYSVNSELNDHIKNVIKSSVENNQPIKIVFPHGAYKLWRLEEAPNPDWAELFTVIYYTKWLKPICEIYQPGIIFEFFVDDYVLPSIDNIPLETVETYINEHQKILNFLKNYQPTNLKMIITKFGDIYGPYEKFKKELQESVEKLSVTNPVFPEEDLRTTKLNANPTKEQLKDPKWCEKILLIHDAYMTVKRGLGYTSNPEKIPVFCQPLSSGKYLIVGTTKTSITKFWIGAGALKKRGDEFIEYILSPSNLESQEFTIEKISINGLDSKNFSSIRIFE